MTCRVAGHRPFCNRRWLDPTSEEDKQDLEMSYELFRSGYPDIEICSWATFLRVLGRMSSRSFEGRGRMSSSSVDGSWRDMTFTSVCIAARSNSHHCREMTDDVSKSETCRTRLNFACNSKEMVAEDLTHVTNLSCLPLHQSRTCFGWNAAGGMNVGQWVDWSLHLSWTNVPTMRIDADYIEQFTKED